MTTINLKSFLTKDSFAEKIEELVFAGNMTYFEAIVEFANECDKSPEELLPFMSQVLLDKVRKSASDLGLVDSKNDTDLEEFLG
jgi:hypothetical protein